MKKLLTILSFTTLFIACKKSDDGAYTKSVKESHVVVRFKNTFSERMYADVYRTAEDYQYSRNAILSFSLDAQDTLRHTFYNLDSFCYIDIYNGSKILSNWCRWTNIPIPLKTTAPFSSDINYNHVFSFDIFDVNEVDFVRLCNDNVSGDRRSIAISGNKPLKRWKAVGGTNWANMTEDERHTKITITKNLRFLYEWKNNGAINIDSGKVYDNSFNGDYALVLEAYSDNSYYVKIQDKDTLLIREASNFPNGYYKLFVAE